ncbi:MAG: hypothetical protein OM95_15985 [Bdellovibrio sp. ArHS]|uniref:DUF1634 domain-containing protein n=1 Tax=Bdellovibrio sp. ArHS TaxID=1569284 RepID=UPI000582A5D7|nr:DUF1634 domain-containing protein [Bdellovibrio sp. ArHS]KHD87128.1 MAG: hypothetical protein OM95_15985 [Bdellovibrio sp. ArHS]
MTVKAVGSEAEKNLNRLEYRISQLLRSGVLFAGIFLLVGWLWLRWNGANNLSSLTEYRPTSLWESLQWAFLMKDRGLLISYAGLIILVLLPVVRVFLTGILFLKQRENKLAIMAFAVFIALVGSFFLGIDL